MLNDFEGAGAAGAIYPDEALPGGFLIVDDVSINIFITEEMLMPYGIPIDTARSGMEAVEKVKAGNKYDIIFMDHMMPGMNGVEATKIIRSTGYTGCIIALSANSPGENDKLYLDSGFNRYLSKPIDQDELDDLVNDFVDFDKYDTYDAGPSSTDDLINSLVVEKEEKKGNVTDFFLLDANAAIKVLDKMFAVPHTVTHEEMERYEITMHGIKSALGNMGERTLSADAYALEQAAKHGDYSIIFEDTPEFIKALKEYVATVEQGK